jgi:hypothetical protein
VRSEKSKKALVKKIGQKYEDKIQIVDVTDANQLDAVFAGADSLVMCTSVILLDVFFAMDADASLSFALKHSFATILTKLLALILSFFQAVPKIKIRSIIKVILLKLIRKSGRPGEIFALRFLFCSPSFTAGL